jgi:2'-5' RNA ligase
MTGDEPATAGPATDEEQRRRRVFFGLWPDEATAAAIVRATKRAVRLSGGRPIAKERLHITVAFLGELTAEELGRAFAAAPVATGAFDLTLDTVGFFPRSRVLWLAAREVPQALNELEQRLWVALEERGFAREPRIYRPHVTLAKKARAVSEDVDSIAWRVEELVLIESLPAGRSVHYEPLQRWAL